MRNAYPGIDVDYRGISPDLRDDYTQFITELAAALHQNQKQLSVRFELPAQVSADTWDTGVYDWVAIGAVADMVKVPVPEDVHAYEPGGQMDSMLSWAVGQVNRYKIQLADLHTQHRADPGRCQTAAPLQRGTGALQPRER